jgi:hypothetical protein
VKVESGNDGQKGNIRPIEDLDLLSKMGMAVFCFVFSIAVTQFELLF